MNASGKPVQFARLGRLLFGVAVVAYVFSRLIPCTSVSDYPMVDRLENSWTQALHLAFLHHLQAGTEIIFTYGPWGFLARGYHPQTYPVAVVAWGILSVIFLFAGWRVAKIFSANKFLAGLWLVAFTALASLPAGEDFNTRLVAWCVLLLCLHFFVEERAVTILQAALAVSLGWMGLVKFTGLIEGGVVIAVIAVDNIFRQRRFPWIIPLWLAGFLFFWFAAGQSAGSLLPFLVNSWRVTSGYGEAMMLAAPTEFRDNLGFLLVAVLLGAGFARAAWRRHRWFGLLPLAGLTALLLISFKLGCLRTGWQHATTAAAALVLVALAGLAIARREKINFNCAAVVLALSVALAGLVFGEWFPGNGLPRQLAKTFSLPSLAAPVAASVTGSLRADYEKNLASERNEMPLPRLTGGTDLYAHDQSILFAHGLSYQPRPVLQSYSAYTPELAELDAAHLRKNSAATNILFALQPLDERFPALDDGWSWPELLTRYDCKGSAGSVEKFLLLQRASIPRTFQLTPLNKTIASLGGEKLILPAATNGLVWVEIEINKTFSGKLAEIFYKPPVLHLTVNLHNHETRRYRLVPGMARAGFLLSPLVADNRSFAALFTAAGRESLAGLQVESVSITAETKTGSTTSYQPFLPVKFFRLACPPQ